MLWISVTVALLLITPPTEAALGAATIARESDGDPTATECPRSPAARTARRHHDDPTYATPDAPCFCGLYQTTATSPASCLAQREPAVGRATWVRQRAAWRRVCAAHATAGADLELCTIAGYARGTAGALAALGLDDSRQGRAGVAYARRLLMAAALRAAAHRAPLPQSRALW